MLKESMDADKLYEYKSYRGLLITVPDEYGNKTYYIQSMNARRVSMIEVKEKELLKKVGE